jgi:hypothetical protein
MLFTMTRSIMKFCFFGVLVLSPLLAFACDQTSDQKKSAQPTENRIVFLDVTLKKSGAVRDAKVIGLSNEWSAAALRAIKEKNFKHHIVIDPNYPYSITAAVTFPLDNYGKPDIRQALPAGVSSCVPGGTVRVVPFERYSFLSSTLPLLPALPAVQVPAREMQAQLLTLPSPLYLIEQQDATSIIVLQLHIDEKGSVDHIEKVSGPDSIAATAIDIVKTWKYEPYRLSGTPVEVETSVQLDCFQSIGCDFRFN